MVNLENILLKEKSNKSIIYLYERGDKWYAYEQSAYHFSKIFHLGEIEQTNEFICVAIGDEHEFLYSKAMGNVKIISVADNKVEIDCGTAFAGFEHWKQKLLIKSNTL